MYVCMYVCLCSGHVGERTHLRVFLSVGMTGVKEGWTNRISARLLIAPCAGSAVMCVLFGLAYFWNIHQLWYFVVVQVCIEMFACVHVCVSIYVHTLTHDMYAQIVSGFFQV